MGSLKLLGDWILTFDKVRRTGTKVFQSKYWHKYASCFVWHFRMFFVGRRKRRISWWWVACFFLVTTTLWYPQIRIKLSKKGGCLPKYCTFYFTQTSIFDGKQFKPRNSPFTRSLHNFTFTGLLRSRVQAKQMKMKKIFVRVFLLIY